MPHIPSPEMIAILIYPDIPQEELQQFLTIQYFIQFSSPYPTIDTTWLTVVPQ